MRGDLRKVYGEFCAVDGVSFEVADGEIYALLGHNGAGKSTTVEILEGDRERVSGGDVTVIGHDPGSPGRDFRDRIGIVLQSSGVEHELTVAEAVEIYSSCYRRRRERRRFVGLVGLGDQLDRRVGHLSGGQRRRLDLAMGIAGWPDVLFLDEPTTGFDPAALLSCVGPDRRAPRDQGTDDPAHHPLPGGGGAPRRPGRRAPPPDVWSPRGRRRS